ncbi:MAG: glycine--tRNA ligase subunit beta [bacterium]
MRIFLLEVGTEELPPGVIAGAAHELRRRVTDLLADNGIEFGETELFWTPRRLGLRIRDVADERPVEFVELPGPPKRAGFDAQGQPTKTAIGFAAAHGKTVDELYVKQTPKGEYLFVRKVLPAVPSQRVLGGNLPAIIARMPFPKTMRWDQSGLNFSRPVRWVLCLLGDEVVPFELAGLSSGNTTFGNRACSRAPVVIKTPEDYEAVLEKYGVIVSPEQRRSRVLKRLAQLAAEVNGEVVKDDELVSETVNITEFVEPIRCRFNPEYLKLPREVLVTALKKHQRCFSVQRQDGKLLPYFIAVADTPGCDIELVRSWYERAVESRLRDAGFFVEADLKQGLLPLVEDEKRVVWIEGLGSYYDKTQRLRRLCGYLAGVLALGAEESALLDRAALLCKADLLTNLVREKEFTALQGLVGSIYSRLLGEPEAVACAIAEHYQPRSLEDDLPRTVLGGLLSIADKVDNIVATYLTGNIPTGSEDPFAVRRQATGVLLIILERGWSIEIDELVHSGFVELGRHDDRILRMVLELFQERLAAILAERGISYDVANAVLKTVWHTPAEALARAKGLKRFRTSPEFEQLVIGQKRVANILRGQSCEGQPEDMLFQEMAEKELWEKAQRVEPALEEALDKKDYDEALTLLLSLREAIDRFFDDVLVMCEDERLRNNRLKLLNYVRFLFKRVADFSEIVL